MTQRKLREVVRRIAAMYGSPQKSRRLQAVAKSLGRRRAGHGAYAWESRPFPHLRPLSIPHHSRDVPRYTAESILDHLMQYDVPAWEETLRSEDGK